MPDTPDAPMDLTPADPTTDPTPPVAAAIDPDELDALLHEHRAHTRPQLTRLWDYYRNPPADFAAAPTSANTAQARGLPARLRRSASQTTSAAGASPTRETVIENDIAWRVHTLVDFVFGQPPRLQSLHPDPRRARQLQRFVRRVIDAAGGPGFYQTLGLLGSVYGHADILLRLDHDQLDRTSMPSGADDPDVELPVPPATGFCLDPVDATRGVPVQTRHDYRELEAYLVHAEIPDRRAVPIPGRFLQRVRQRIAGYHRAAPGATEHTTLYTPHRVEQYAARPTAIRDRRTRVSTRDNPLGRIPLVHIQNLPQPFYYPGLSDVEPLIPLQDELNTRLSDRANRVTFQSFQMFLGKGIDGFTDKPVGPGQMWSTDNPDASIETFGGDGDSPSETAHIQEIREALDKASGVPPVAAGLLRDKVGNLTSENALRIVLMGLLAKAEKKRTTYGAGLTQLAGLILHAADATGVLPNTEDERGFRVDWPDPLPPNQNQALRQAKTKLDLGVPREQVLSELGYEAQA